jgi:16S rRNA (guanine527-N7)-methyltransferase
VHDPELVAVLERSRALGFLGPGPVDDHIDHAGGFVRAVARVTGRLVDLGSGGGVPGLVLALARPDLEVVLVDAMAKRCNFLAEAIATLGLAHARVVHGRAEVVGRGELRGSAAAVVARSFGPPAVTAECAAPLLRPGGLLVVSEPPGAAERWDAEGLALLGLRLDHRTSATPALQVLVQATACEERFPRRDGMPAKRPLF